MCYLTCPAQKYITSVRFFTWFLNLGKTQDSSQDADQVCWRHRLSAAPPHIKFTSFCRESQRLCTDGKIVKNSRGRFHQPSPPPPLYYGGGMTLRVRPRDKQTSVRLLLSSTFSGNDSRGFIWEAFFWDLLGRTWKGEIPQNRPWTILIKGTSPFHISCFRSTFEIDKNSWVAFPEYKLM